MKQTFFLFIYRSDRYTQNEIKREELYKRPNCVLQNLPLLHSLCVEN